MMVHIIGIGSLHIAIGTSFVAEAASAISYAVSGLVDWSLAGLFILGGTIGGFVGIKIAVRLAGQKRALSLVFNTVVALVGIYVVAQGVLTTVP